MRQKQEQILLKAMQGMLPTWPFNKAISTTMIRIYTKQNGHQLQSCQAASHSASLLFWSDQVYSLRQWEAEDKSFRATEGGGSSFY